MFGENDFDNTAIDLDRVRKLAGIADTGYEAPAASYAPEDSFELDPEDVPGSGAMGSGDGLGVDDLDSDDFGMDGLGSDHIALSAPVDAVAPIAPEQNHWSMVLSDLEKQMPDIPVGDFRDVIDSLRRLANYAEDIRRTLVTEHRKSFRDYVSEAIQGVPTVPTVPSAPSVSPAPKTASNANNQQTLGNNRQEAIKTLQNRMGGDPKKAESVFANMQKKGMIKANGSAFTMQSMDDDQFNTTVNDPSFNQ